jgi:hypothetical protein
MRELSATQSVVERKTTIPILSNFLLEAGPGEGDATDRLTITATDLDQSIRTSCAARVKKPGACTIPARKLFDYVNCCPTVIYPSSSWRTTGYRFVPAAPTPRWWAWREPILTNGDSESLEK